MAMSELALANFGTPEGTEHTPGSPYDEHGKFHCDCKCGWSSRANTTPTAAYQKAKEHADAANAGGDAAPAARTSSPAPRKTSAPATPAQSVSCGCGCGSTATRRAGSPSLVFLPGHDAKLLSRLVTDYAKNRIDREAALSVVAERPKLADKLAARLDKVQKI